LRTNPKNESNKLANRTYHLPILLFLLRSRVTFPIRFGTPERKMKEEMKHKHGTRDDTDTILPENEEEKKHSPLLVFACRPSHKLGGVVEGF